jgi:SAM-dependent methyltransferase
MSSHDVRRAARVWGDRDRAAFYARGGLTWLDLDRVRRRVNSLVSGSPDVDWLSHVAGSHLAGRIPVARALSLCCGDGRIERELVSRGIAASCLGIDAAPGAITRARELAADAGLSAIGYDIQDANTVALPYAEFDLIVGHHALHHVENLEHLMAEVGRSLKPDGLFVLLDYIGPSRFGISERRAELCTAALRLLPERFRRSVSWERSGAVGPGAPRSPLDWARLLWRKLRNGTLGDAIGLKLRLRAARTAGEVYVRTEVQRLRPSEVALDDPSEAVRSDEIPPLLARRFDLIEVKQLGGSVLRLVLDDIAGNFEPETPESASLLEMLIAVEDALLASGEVESDFAFVVARPLPARDGPPARSCPVT